MHFSEAMEKGTFLFCCDTTRIDTQPNAMITFLQFVNLRRS